MPKIIFINLIRLMIIYMFPNLKRLDTVVVSKKEIEQVFLFKLRNQ